MTTKLNMCEDLVFETVVFSLPFEYGGKMFLSRSDAKRKTMGQRGNFFQGDTSCELLKRMATSLPDASRSCLNVLCSPRQVMTAE